MYEYELNSKHIEVINDSIYQVKLLILRQK